MTYPVGAVKLPDPNKADQVLPAVVVEIRTRAGERTVRVVQVFSGRAPFVGNIHESGQARLDQLILPKDLKRLRTQREVVFVKVQVAVIINVDESGMARSPDAGAQSQLVGYIRECPVPIVAPEDIPAGPCTPLNIDADKHVNVAVLIVVTPDTIGVAIFNGFGLSGWDRPTHAGFISYILETQRPGLDEPVRK